MRKLLIVLAIVLTSCAGQVDLGRAIQQLQPAAVDTSAVTAEASADAVRQELAQLNRELPEGVRMMGNVTGCGVDAVFVGMPVEAYAVAAAERVGVPFWRPALDPVNR